MEWGLISTDVNTLRWWRLGSVEGVRDEWGVLQPLLGSGFEWKQVPW